MKLAFTLALVAILGCKNIRNQTVYRTETEFTDLVVRRGAPTVSRYLQTQCTCTDSHWTSVTPEVTDNQCGAAADWWFTYTSRWSWHLNMVRYNGSLTEIDPGAAPALTPVSCTLPTDPQ